MIIHRKISKWQSERDYEVNRLEDQNKKVYLPWKITLIVGSTLVVSLKLSSRLGGLKLKVC